MCGLIRRYLKPEFGCLRCKRGSSWAAAWTRYLKTVHAAVLADIGGLPSSADSGSSVTESDKGTGGKVAGSAASPAGDLFPQSHDPQWPVASPPRSPRR